MGAWVSNCIHTKQWDIIVNLPEWNKFLRARLSLPNSAHHSSKTSDDKQRADVPRWSAVMTILTRASRPFDYINSNSGEATQPCYLLCNFMDWVMFYQEEPVSLSRLHINEWTLR